MTKRIIQWWTAYFLGGMAVELLLFSLATILYIAALTANGLPLPSRSNAFTVLLFVGIVLLLINIPWATWELFLCNSENGIRNIPPFSFKLAVKWWIGGLIYSTSPSNVLDDFVGFRRK